MTQVRDVLEPYAKSVREKFAPLTDKAEAAISQALCENLPLAGSFADGTSSDDFTLAMKLPAVVQTAREIRPESPAWPVSLFWYFDDFIFACDGYPLH